MGLLKNQLMSTKNEFLTKINLPQAPGIYRMLDRNGNVIYVGKAANLKKRVNSYFSKTVTSAKTSSLLSQIASIEISVTKTEVEALLLESNLIKTLQPKYNVLLRDDKSYPYIHITSNHNFPRITFYRSKTKPKTGNFYGPYPNVNAAREVLHLVRKIFKIRNCRDSEFGNRLRPCLQYQIKRCTAPCVAQINNTEYHQAVQHAMDFLQGKSQQIITSLSTQMAIAVSEMNFEKAAIFRDQIKNLRLIQEQQNIVQAHGDADVIAMEVKPGFGCIQLVTVREGQIIANRPFFPTVPWVTDWEPLTEAMLRQQVLEAFVGFYYLDRPQDAIPALIILDAPIQDTTLLAELLSNIRGKICKIKIKPRGSQSKWLNFATDNLRIAVAESTAATALTEQRYRSLEELLHLKKHIKHLECFDISHTQGSNTVASCVVFDRSGPLKKEYRKFNITSITPGDDYAAMKQVLERRCKLLLKNSRMPEVMVIDGGRGQVNVAQSVLVNLNIHDVNVIGIAKGRDRKVGWEHLILAAQDLEITLPLDSKAMHLLQHIRDEAHRFAVTAHRKKRQVI